MSSRVVQSEPRITVEKTYEGLVPQQLLEIYRLMYLSRRIDDREIMLKRQQKIFFQISCAGHEALLLAAAANLRAGYDWFFPYYRDRALCLALGVTPEAMFCRPSARRPIPPSGGRQMPSHWGSREHNIFTTSSPTGTQFLQAVGCAEAGLYFTRHPGSRAKVPTAIIASSRMSQHYPDEVTYVSGGDGTTSQGEFWESINTASKRKLPLLYRHRRQRLRHLRPGRSTRRRAATSARWWPTSPTSTLRSATAPTC